jgi:hypothetical protein
MKLKKEQEKKRLCQSRSCPSDSRFGPNFEYMSIKLKPEARYAEGIFKKRDYLENLFLRIDLMFYHSS